MRFVLQPTALPAMEGVLAPNERLATTEHLHEGKLIAAEAFAIGDKAERGLAPTFVYYTTDQN